MDKHVLCIDASKKPLVKENLERIALLFGVRISLRDENGPGGHQETLCTMVANDAPDSLEKAKNYIGAIVGAGPEWRLSEETYSPAIVNMITKNRDYIESSTQVLVSVGHSLDKVRFQGSLANVCSAKSIIESLSSRTMPQETQVDTDYSNDKENELHWQSALSNESLEINVSVDGDPTFLSEFANNPHQYMYSTGHSYSPCRTPDSYTNSSTSDHVILENRLSDLGLHSAVAELKISSHTESSDDDLDDSHEIEYCQKDPDYQSKVEFAVKLGYSESHLLKALAKLGVDAGQNELLSELIKQGSVNPQDSGVIGGETLDQSQDPLLDNDEEISRFTSLRKQDESEDDTNLRPIVIDGSNLAMSHGNKEVFSCKGIQLAVDWFRARGHKVITVFVPQWRKETSRSNASIKDQEILTQLEKENILVFTPSRRINGKRVVCYDDRYVLNLAVETDGIVVSNDNYRDLLNEKVEFKKVVEERLLMYSFVNNRFMPPEDPLGRSGPTLENFLQKEPTVPEPLPPLCPYGSKKCTYGNKCKFYHPERKNMRHKTVTEKLAEDARQRMEEMRKSKSSDAAKKSLLKKSVQRTHSVNLSDFKRESSPVSSLDGSHPWGSTTNLDTEEEDRYKQYNQKLAEKRKKMEQEEALHDMQASPMSDDFGKQSGLMWSDNARNSPVNLNVPGRSNFDNQEFLSGHLLLAKKLSDEAESDKQKNHNSDCSDRSMMSSPNQHQMHSPEPARPLQRTGAGKQKLSRQLSLQGSEDPRLKHRGLAPTYSHDPRHIGGSGQQFDPRFVNGSHDLDDSLLSDFQQGQNQERNFHFPSSTGDSSQLRNYSGPMGDLPHPSMPRDPMSGHVPVSRMVSAPDPYLRSQQVSRRIPPMRRQNSSSDPQLHKTDELDLGQHGNSAMLSRGALPLKDRTGSVRFQIGGGSGPQSTSTMQSFGPPMQGYPQYSMSEMDFYQPTGYGNMTQQQQHHQQQQQQHLQQQQQQQQQQHHQPHHQQQQQHQQQPQHQQQQQMGMPYGNRPPGHPLMQPSLPPQHSQQQHMAIGPPMNLNYGQIQPPMYGHKGNVWMDDMPAGVNSPGQMLPMSMHTSPGQMPPMSMHSVGSGGVGMPNHRQQQQQQQQASLPDDTPILAGDPRYKVYYHLCELFPEVKVRVVMNQHPELTDAAAICSYIIGTK